MDTKTIQSFKHRLKEAQKKRNITRQKYLALSHDELILNGMRVSFAFDRLFVVSKSCIDALSLKASGTDEKAQKAFKALKIKASKAALKNLKICLHDCIVLKRLKHLLPDDKILRDEYLTVVHSTQIKLLSIGKKQ